MNEHERRRESIFFIVRLLRRKIKEEKSGPLNPPTGEVAVAQPNLFHQFITENKKLSTLRKIEGF
jgi:hypothetical protein